MSDSRYQSGKPAHEGGPPSWGFVSLCITIYRWKNHFCKKIQWCLWRFMYPLSFHQFIEISILALKKKKFKHFDVAPPVKLCAPAGLPARRTPKLSGELSSQAPYVHTELLAHIISRAAQHRSVWKKNFQRNDRNFYKLVEGERIHEPS